MKENNDKPFQFHTIQALRGIAAILILLLHTSKSLTFTGANSYGFIGVDIFFVISGFVMVYTSWGNLGTNTYGIKFIKNRAIRIYSNYWLILLMFVALHYTNILKIAPDKNILLSFSLINQPVKNQILPVAWTLTHEMFFYVIFTITFFIPGKYFVKFFVLWAAILLIATAIIERKKGVTSPNVAFYLSPLHLEFIAGCCVGWLIRKNKHYYPITCLSIGLIVITITAFLTSETPLRGWENTIWRAIFYGGGSAIAIYGLIQLEILNKISAPRFLTLLGDASYTLYLVHLPIIMLMGQYLMPQLANTTIAAIFPYLLIIVPIAYSIFHYKYLEKPLLNIFRTILK